MIRSGDSLRLTAPEVELLDDMGIDATGVKSPSDFANAIYPWIVALGEVRPDLFEQLAKELSEKKGIKLPPRLFVVASTDSPEQS